MIRKTLEIKKLESQHGPMHFMELAGVEFWVFTTLEETYYGPERKVMMMRVSTRHMVWDGQEAMGWQEQVANFASYLCEVYDTRKPDNRKFCEILDDWERDTTVS